jgi:hypothetical protein
MSTRHIRRFALAAVVAFALGACSDDSDDDTSADTSETTTAEAAEDTTTTTAADETTTTAADAEGGDLTAGGELIASGAVAAGLPEDVGACIGETVYGQLTPEEQAEVDTAGENGTTTSAAIDARLQELGQAAFLSCTAEG